MNFILPDIFDDLGAFQDWFNLPTLQNSLPTDQTTSIISSLHAILKPFLLRRLKVDVLAGKNGEGGAWGGGLPPKKEYVLYAPLSVRQKEAYQAVLSGRIREWLIKGGTQKKSGGAKEVVVVQDDDGEKEADHESEDEDKGGKMSRRLRKKGKKNYLVDGDDDEYFEMLDRDLVDERGLKRQSSQQEKEEEQKRAALEYQTKAKSLSFSSSPITLYLTNAILSPSTTYPQEKQ